MEGQTDALRAIVQTLDSLGIPYVICGSVASSIHGTFRATADIDILVDLRQNHVLGLIWDLGQDFIVDADALESAIRDRRTINLIHLDTGEKVDIFPASASVFNRKELERAQVITLRTGESEFRIRVASPEDTILSKLVWYRQGGEVSERQWNDVRGVIAVTGTRLDRAYLNEWAEALGVADLLRRVLT